MGLLSWWKGKPVELPSNSKPQPYKSPNSQSSETPANQNAEAPGMNGAVEVPRAARVTVFEFGSVSTSSDKVTLAGYCPVSDELEPCRWEILPAVEGALSSSSRRRKHSDPRGNTSKPELKQPDTQPGFFPKLRFSPVSM